ncbi:response regulator transcription factor [Cupriavidus pampae]|uniref:Transcriptional regulatory protein RcsB n=1 Tax=Cupriavidus pampae TaxID=659251 RepID=A0ABM8XYT3_9BURK|nr:response regulator transcription factor [Cupriavidus pampae]CAG9185464.1 Transcriptional regulatory protein RcsB [Cupriavidus pampae]
MIKVIVADDHPVVLDGICRALAQGNGIEIVGQAGNSTGLMRLLDNTACDIIVTDYAMPGGQYGDGLPMLQMLRRRYPTTRIVVMTMLDNPALIRNIWKIGVSSIINKADEVEQLFPAIRAAFRGQHYVTPLVQSMLSLAHPDRPEPGPRLSRRELEVLRRCAQGIPLVEIARVANRSAKTISAQKSVAMKKLGLSNDYELYEYAKSSGLLGDAD